MKKQTVSLAALSLIVNFSGDAQASLQQDPLESNTKPPLYRTMSFSENRPEDFVTISALSEKGDFLEGLFTAVKRGDFLEQNKERVHRHRSKIMTAFKTEIDRLEKQGLYGARETSKKYRAHRY